MQQQYQSGNRTCNACCYHESLIVQVLVSRSARSVSQPITAATRSVGTGPIVRAFISRPRAWRSLPSNRAWVLLTPAEPTAGSSPVPARRSDVQRTRIASR
jgi:hypothetical protein